MGNSIYTPEYLNKELARMEEKRDQICKELGSGYDWILVDSLIAINGKIQQYQSKLEHYGEEAKNTNITDFRSGEKIKNAMFDEKYFNESCGELILYFEASKSVIQNMFPNKYPEAVSTEISLSFPAWAEEYAELVADKAHVSISPTNKNGEDYDWTDVNIDVNEIQQMIFLSNISNDQLLDELKTNAYSRAGRINSCADDKDINRNHVNYGCLTGNLAMIRKFGITTDCAVWEDTNGCLRIPKITIGKEEFELISGKSENWIEELKEQNLQPVRRQGKCR